MQNNRYNNRNNNRSNNRNYNNNNHQPSQWQDDNGKPFVNPYNFVSLGKTEPDRKTISEWRGKMTGRIRCNMQLQRPMALPDHANEEGGRYPLLQRNGKPFVPGSELRGMVRSVFEVATHSCMSVLDDTPITARNNSTQGCYPALLSFTNQGWRLYSATEYLINTFRPGEIPYYRIEYETSYGKPHIQANGTTYYNGDKVQFASKQPQNRIEKPRVTAVGVGEQTGYLLLGEKGLRGNNAHNSHVFAKNPGAQGWMVDDDAVLRLQRVLDEYRDPKINRCLDPDNHSGYNGMTIKKDGSMIPVFYRKVGNIYYLSPSFMGREAYRNRISNLVGRFAPCNGKEICTACGLFGMVSDTVSYGSAVRFTDATFICESEPLIRNRVVLKELSSPKPSAVEFYTKRPEDADTWRYDYKRIGRRTIECAPEILGRKFYLHHANFNVNQVTSQERTERNVTTDLLMPHAQNKQASVFSFDVYFDQIQKEQLKQILWALSPADRNDDPLYHKLGLGKPLGLGSVRIEIEEVTVRIVDENGYSESNWAEDEICAAIRETAESVPAALIKILNYNLTSGMEVRYPSGTDPQRPYTTRTGGHQWFIGNRGTVNNPQIQDVLPTIGNDLKQCDDLTLYDKVRR